MNPPIQIKEAISIVLNNARILEHAQGVFSINHQFVDVAFLGLSMLGHLNLRLNVKSFFEEAESPAGNRTVFRVNGESQMTHALQMDSTRHLNERSKFGPNTAGLFDTHMHQFLLDFR